MNVIPMRVELPCNAHESAVGNVDSDIGTFTDSVDDDDDDDDDEPDDAEDDSAAASTEEVEALLAREWNQLTLQEREAINEEVHGVRDEYRDVVDKETPELLHGSLRQLALELDAIPKKPAYHTCQTEYGATTWVNTAEFRLLFLRSEFFDAKKAAARIVAFLELSRSCWGDFVLEREVCLSDLSEQDRVLLDSGLLQMLPGRDRCGRRVLIHFTHNNVGPTRPKESRVRIASHCNAIVGCIACIVVSKKRQRCASSVPVLSCLVLSCLVLSCLSHPSARFVPFSHNTHPDNNPIRYDTIRYDSIPFHSIQTDR